MNCSATVVVERESYQCQNYDPRRDIRFNLNSCSIPRLIINTDEISYKVIYIFHIKLYINYIFLYIVSVVKIVLDFVD